MLAFSRTTRGTFRVPLPPPSAPTKTNIEDNGRKYTKTETEYIMHGRRTGMFLTPRYTNIRYSAIALFLDKPYNICFVEGPSAQLSVPSKRETGGKKKTRRKHTHDRINSVVLTARSTNIS